MTDFNHEFMTAVQEIYEQELSADQQMATLIVLSALHYLKTACPDTPPKDIPYGAVLTWMTAHTDKQP